MADLSPTDPSNRVLSTNHTRHPPTSPPYHLPQPLTSFVGRTAEKRAVQHLLTQSRLLTLTGAGGSGKTRLGKKGCGNQKNALNCSKCLPMPS